MVERSSPADLRSFGRRRGRKLSSRQEQLLAQGLQAVRLDLSCGATTPPTTQFDPPVREVWLEIGFGGGEHLIWQAIHNPDIGLIGCEPFVDGVVKVIGAIETNGLRNVRVHADDARIVLQWLPPASVGRVFILFPDPWPKRRHHKRRLVSPSLLASLARIVKSGGEVRIATDIGDYARTALTAVRLAPAFDWLAASAADWRVRPSDWPSTRYEQKALEAGRRCIYLRFRRR